jgi:hypothetical protein
MKSDRQSGSLIAGSICALLWLGALVIAGVLSLMGFVETGFAPLLDALTFLLSFPVTLLGVWSFRASAIGLAGLLFSDLFTSSWPHVSITSYFESKIAIILLTLAVLNLFIWCVSPFKSIVAFLKQVRDKY